MYMCACDCELIIIMLLRMKFDSGSLSDCVQVNLNNLQHSPLIYFMHCMDYVIASNS